MFSPRIYWRLFASLNDAWWPAQLLLVAAPTLWLLRVRTVGARLSDASLRVALAFLALCWLLTATTFLQQRFAPINWAASGYAMAFIGQSLTLAVLAAVGGLRADVPALRRHIGLLLGSSALLAYPLLAIASGRPWQQAEVFGLAPDPTVIGTLACLLLIHPTHRAARWISRLLWCICLLWLAVSVATLATMGAHQAWVVLAATLLAVAAARLKPAAR